jgi:hypothetical protein
MNGTDKKLELLGRVPIPKALLALGLPTMIGMMINMRYTVWRMLTLWEGWEPARWVQSLSHFRLGRWLSVLVCYSEAVPLLIFPDY